MVTQFEKNGLKPAGDKGYLQTVPLHVVRLQTDESKIELVRPSGVTKLHWLRQITTAARAGLPEKLEAPLVFAGVRCARAADVAGQDRRAVAGCGAARGGGRGVRRASGCRRCDRDR